MAGSPAIGEAPLWPSGRAVWLASRRRSSVVERVIGNDEVLSSILSGGTINQLLSR